MQRHLVRQHQLVPGSLLRLARSASSYARPDVAPVAPEQLSRKLWRVLEHIPSSTASAQPAFVPSARLPLDSVVKVYTTHTCPSYFLPWQNKTQRESFASGFAIGENLILTNAHAVANHSTVMVRKHGNPTKTLARVLATGHECDLALLTTDEPAFLQDVPPLSFGGTPSLQDQVLCIGFPIGGDGISITSGVVSRIDMSSYSHSGASLLALQIDASINPGNSGGPVLYGSQVVGVAFQVLQAGEGIGYVIPVPVIRHFLEDVARHGRYTGFANLGIVCAPMENPQHREYVGLADDQSGVLITDVLPSAASAAHLRKDDVLLAFDGTRIANDGSVPFREQDRVSFDHLLLSKFVGDTARLDILRDHHGVSLDVPLDVFRPLVPIHVFDQRPSFFVFAGLVFVPLTQPYLQEYGPEWYSTAPRRLMFKALMEKAETSDEQVVILSRILVSDINIGYQHVAGGVLVRVNGQNIKHMRDLVSAVASARRELHQFLRFEFEGGNVLVLNTKDAERSDPWVQKQHSVSSLCSDDLAFLLPEPASEAVASSLS